LATLYRCSTPTNWLCPCGRVARALVREAIPFQEVIVPQRRSRRPETWRAAAAAAAPGGVVVLVGGCPGGTEITLPTGPLHYEELELRGSFHHSRDDVDRALKVLADDDALWRTLLGPTISLEQLPGALATPTGGPAKKWVVDPRS